MGRVWVIMGIGFAVGMGVLVHGVASWTEVRDEQPVSEADSATAVDAMQLSRLEWQVRQVQQQLAAVQAEASASSREPATTPDDGGDNDRLAEDPDASDVGLARMMAAEEERRNRRYEQLQERLDRESPDPAWARGAEDQIARAVDALTASGLEMELTEADCGGTICRVELTYPSEEAQRVGSRQFLPEGFSRGTVHLFTESGEPKAVAYLAREGHDLRTAE